MGERSAAGAIGAGDLMALHRGRVVRVTAAGTFVRVDRLSGAHEYGPLEVLQSAWATAVGDHGTHTHGGANTLAAGDLVLVGSIGARPDDLVVLGKLA